MAVHCLNEVLCILSNTLLKDSYVLRNRQLFTETKLW